MNFGIVIGGIMKKGIYRHFKGNEYEVIDVCFEEVSGKRFVLYKPLYNDSGFWIRPYDMFFEKVEHLGKEVDRFSFVVEKDSSEEIMEKVASHSESLEKFSVRFSDGKYKF